MVKRVIYQTIFMTPPPESVPTPEGGWSVSVERPVAGPARPREADEPVLGPPVQDFLIWPQDQYQVVRSSPRVSDVDVLGPLVVAARFFGGVEGLLFKALQPYQQFAADGVLGPVTAPAPPQSTPAQAARQDNFTLRRRARVVE